jgi:hypothetical protein
LGDGVPLPFGAALQVGDDQLVPGGEVPVEGDFGDAGSMSNRAPVVFMHGLWIHSNAWPPWVERYAAEGYETHAPGWPGDASDVEQTRANSSAVANHGIDDTTRKYARSHRP